MEGSWDHSQQLGTEPHIKTVALTRSVSILHKACVIISTFEDSFVNHLSVKLISSIKIIIIIIITLTLSVSTLTQAFCKYLNESLL